MRRIEEELIEICHLTIVNLFCRARLPADVRLDPRPEYARCVLSWKDGQAVADVSLTGNQVNSTSQIVRDISVKSNLFCR